MATENLECQYDQVIKYLEGYRQFIGTIFSGVLTRPRRDPQRVIRAIPAIWRQMNPLSGKNADVNRAFASEVATPEEMGSSYYPIVVSDYPLHELSVSLEGKFRGFDFEKLRKLHGLKKTHVSRLNRMKVVGFVLAGAIFLLKQIPEIVVTKLIKYPTFQLAVSGAAFFLVSSLLLALLPLWWKYNQGRIVHEYAGDAIEYTSIRLSQRSNTKLV